MASCLPCCAVTCEEEVNHYEEGVNHYEEGVNHHERGGGAMYRRR